MNEKEIRNIEVELRAEDDNTIKGYAVVFDEEADLLDFTEIIKPGALDDCSLKDVFMTVNHDRSLLPIARSRNNTPNSTLYLEKDGHGLAFTARLDVENPRSAELYSAVRRGDVSGMSVAMVIPDDGDTWEYLNTKKPKRTISKIEKIIEISAVTNPAYKGTEVSCRSLDNARQALESAENAKKLEQMKADVYKVLEAIK